MLERAVVYTPWSREVINDAVTELNAQMHDGAGIPEIEAGLHGLDFLTRRSEIDADLQARIDGCTVEAHMRIELLAEYEAAQRTEQENHQKAEHGVKAMLAGLRAIKEHIRRRSIVDEVYVFGDGFDEEEVTDGVPVHAGNTTSGEPPITKT